MACVLVDKPDPYVKLRVLTSPNSKQRTSFKPNETNPIWNESFTFYLNSEKKNILGTYDCIESNAYFSKKFILRYITFLDVYTYIHTYIHIYIYIYI